MVTHDIKSAAYGDRVIFIKDGAIIDERLKQTNVDESIEEDALLGWLKEREWWNDIDSLYARLLYPVFLINGKEVKIKFYE